MLQLYLFRGLGQQCYIWLCGKKNIKLVKFENSFTADDVALKKSNINNYSKYFDNSYILDDEGVPLMQYVTDIDFNTLLMNNIGIIQKMIDGVNQIEINTSTETVSFSNVGSNSFMSLTLGRMLSDGLNYDKVSDKKRKDLELSVKISKLATIEGMKNKYDCSWIFNDDGTWKKDYRCITTLEELDWVKSELASLPDKYYVGFDVETSGLNIFYMPDEPEKKDRLLGFSLSWRNNQGVYIPLESEVFECLTKEQVLGKLYSELTRLGIIAHNGQFEWKVMYDNGYTMEISEDTMLLNFNIFPMVIKGFSTLKNLTRMWFRHETWEFSQLFGGNADPGMLVYLPKDILTIYGCADSDYARMLFLKLKEYLNESQKLPYSIDCKIIELLGKGEYYGAKKDVKKIDETEKLLTSNLSKIESEMFRYILDKGFENRKTNIVLEALETLESVPGKVLAELGYDGKDERKKLELLNRILPSDEEIKDEFVKEMEGVLTEKALNSDPKLQKILFEVLEYPVITYKRRTKKQKQKEKEKIDEAKSLGLVVKPKPPSPATDEAAMINLLQYRLEETNDYFQDIVADDGSIVLKGDDLNSYKYPFAKLLLEYKDINKQLTTFYKQHHENPSPYWYNENRQCQAVTGRLISTAQLVDKRTKNLIIPYDGCYGVNADYSQIEIRNMAGCANRYWHSMEKLINKDELSVYHRNGLNDYINVLNNPETDIHRQTAANMLRKSAEDVTDDERSGHKQFSFGIPYGMLGFALSANDITEYVDKMSANPDEQLNKIVADNGVGVSKWNFANYPIYRYLEYNRKNILIEREDREGDRIPPYFEGHKVGYVENDYGRRRYFYLDNMNDSLKHSIFKEGGNYPIQSGSRELFFINKLNMYNDMKKMGLVNNPTDGSKPVPDKFFMSIFVHDEFFGSVSEDVHPYDIVKLIYKNCFVNVKYHPTYFMGINFVNNWYDGKKGTNELPVKLVKQIYDVPKEEYPEFEKGFFIIRGDKGNVVNELWVVDYFAQLVKNYELKRILEEIGEVDGEWSSISKRISSPYVKALIVKRAVQFGCTKKNTMAEMLEKIWENREHNFLLDKVKCTKLEVEEDVEESIDDLFGSEEFLAEDFEDEEVFNAMNLHRMISKRKEESFNKFKEESTVQDSHESYQVRKRQEYESKNMYKEEIDNRVILMISGKLILNFNSVELDKQRKILAEIKEKFEDPNGSIIEVMNALGLRRQNFRVFNFTRKDIEEIFKKYD